MRVGRLGRLKGSLLNVVDVSVELRESVEDEIAGTELVPRDACPILDDIAALKDGEAGAEPDEVGPLPAHGLGTSTFLFELAPSMTSVLATQNSCSATATSCTQSRHLPICRPASFGALGLVIHLSNGSTSRIARPIHPGPVELSSPVRV